MIQVIVGGGCDDKNDSWWYSIAAETKTIALSMFTWYGRQTRFAPYVNFSALRNALNQYVIVGVQCQEESRIDKVSETFPVASQ